MFTFQYKTNMKSSQVASHILLHYSYPHDPEFDTIWSQNIFFWKSILNMRNGILDIACVFYNDNNTLRMHQDNLEFLQKKT